MPVTGTQTILPIDEARHQVTQEATRRIAAGIIADAAFPTDRLLPRPAALPGATLGQQLLFDYRLFAELVWGAEKHVRDRVNSDKSGCLAVFVALLIVSLFGVICTAILSQPKSDPQIVLLIGGVGLFLAALAWRTLQADLTTVVAKARAEYLEELLAGKTPKATKEAAKWFSEKGFVDWGDAELSSGTAPVLVMLSDNDPFPGYGKHQARELFVCRPQADKTDPPDALALQQEVSRALIEMVKTTGVASVSSGEIVLIDADTLRKDSGWLLTAARGTIGRPPLSIPVSRLPELNAIDPRTAVRAYTCIQAVIPQYAMCVTFFVRTFLAGNSAACEVNVCTLGPPIYNWDFIRQKLRVHRRESGSSDSTPGEVEETPNRPTDLSAKLRSIGQTLENRAMIFRSPNKLTELPQFDPFEEKALKHEARQVEKITVHSDQWPGIWMQQLHWRESFSFAFTSDFFGSMESRAILRTLFDRIGRESLSTLKRLGYDISDYQDDSGRFNINASRIEQLVLGEIVNVDSKKTPAREAGEKATEGSTPTTAPATPAAQ